jgi:F-type H+-transporting ATPase subunit gamma
MPSLRDVRIRIRTIKQTLQVTKAMNLISTSKLRKGRQVLANTTPYFDRIQRTMTDILSGAGKVDSPYFKRSEGPTAIVAVTSDKGLAGGYNANIYHYVLDLCAQVKDPVLIVVGQVGLRYFQSCPYKVLHSFTFNAKLPCMDDAQEVAEFITGQFTSGAFSEARIVYTHMFNVVKHKPVERLLLPLDRDEMRAMRYAAAEATIEHIEHKEGGKAKAKTTAGADSVPGALPAEPPPAVNETFEYVPEEVVVFDALAPQYVAGLIYGSLIEGYTSEQAERMTAMDQSSRNAEDMLADLQVFYNRARQANITQEITEIVSGSAALSG